MHFSNVVGIRVVTQFVSFFVEENQHDLWLWLNFTEIYWNMRFMAGLQTLFEHN